LAQNEDFLRVAVQALVQRALEAVMTQAIGAENGERTETRLTHRNG
jgi:transposase-like protein